MIKAAPICFPHSRKSRANFLRLVRGRYLNVPRVHNAVERCAAISTQFGIERPLTVEQFDQFVSGFRFSNFARLQSGHCAFSRLTSQVQVIKDRQNPARLVADLAEI